MRFPLAWFKSHLRYPASIQEEGDVLNCQVDVVVILKFRKGEEVVPVILSLVDKEAEKLF